MPMSTDPGEASNGESRSDAEPRSGGEATASPSLPLGVQASLSETGKLERIMIHPFTIKGQVTQIL